MKTTTNSNNKKTISGFFKITLTIIFLIFFSVVIYAQLIFENGFENGSSDWNESGSWRPVPANVESSNTSREGNKSVRFLPVSDNKRSEFTIRNSAGTFNWGEEFWVGFSIYIVQHLTGFRIISQHHSVPHLMTNGDPDWSCTAGPNSFIILAKNDHFDIRTSTIASNVNIVPPIGSASWGTQVVSSPYQLNQWHDFVLHYRYALDNSGFIEVWVDGEKMVDKHNTPTVYKYDLCGEPRAERQYQKIGMYYGNGNQGGEILYDAFRIGIGSSVIYEDVAPDGNSPLSINEIENNNIIVYPNPINNGLINVKSLGNFIIESVKIHTVLGKEVFSKRINLSENNITLKTDLIAGIYTIRLLSDKSLISKKLILE